MYCFFHFLFLSASGTFFTLHVFCFLFFLHCINISGQKGDIVSNFLFQTFGSLNHGQKSLARVASTTEVSDSHLANVGGLS